MDNNNKKVEEKKKQTFTKQNVNQQRETITQFAENQKLERIEYWRKLAERTR